MANSAQGEDRSAYQEIGAWKDLDFGWCKATEGTSLVDAHFSANWANLGQQVGHRGAYHFFHPSFSASAQAELFMTAVTQHGLHRGDMLAIDAEIAAGLDGSQVMHASAVSKSGLVRPDVNGRVRISPGISYPHRLLRRSLPPKITAELVNSSALVFLEDVASHVRDVLGGNYCPIFVYTFTGFLSQLGYCTGYPLWTADWSSEAPGSVAPWNAWTMWQYAGGGGQYGSDQDAFNGDSRAMYAWAASYATEPAPVQNWTEKLVEELPELAEGASGEDVRTAQGCLTARGHAVTVDGNFGPLTAAAVRDVQASRKLTQNGKIEPLTWSALLNR